MGRILAFVALFVLLTLRFGKKPTNALTPELCTSIKGVAAVLIVLTHCITHAVSSESIWSQLSTGWLTVTVFFFLSGYGSAYGLCRKEGYAKHFLRNRFVRVYVPFLLCVPIYAVYRICTGMSCSVRGILLNLIGGWDVVPHLWYVFVTLFFYVFLYLAFRLSSRRVPRILLLTAFVAAFTFALWAIVGSARDYWFISNFSFVFGAALQLFDPPARTRKFLIPGASVCAAGGFLLLPVCNRLFGGYVYPAYILSCNLGSGFLVSALLLLLTFTAGSNRVTAFLGKISYEIYLYHILFVWLCSFVLHIENAVLLFAATTAMTIPFAALMHIPDEALSGKLCRAAPKRSA